MASRIVQTPVSTRVSWVSDLLDASSGCWNVSLVREVFASEEADRILNIPLSRSVRSNLLVWHGDPSGSYTVRSGYLLLRSSNTGGASSSLILEATRSMFTNL